MKGQTNNSILKGRLQRRLRDTMTDAELRLWQCLRRRQMDGFKFRRQHPFGDYILDFVCLEAMLVIEVDGGHHGDHAARDMIRTATLAKAGFRVLRFWNNEVLHDIEAVKESIWGALHSPPPSQPSP
ncbi:MAG: endonuclease domain-containing protein [Burkholderiales bacterium]|nr:endonuclease domain-containing protein [Burkholderiales bacterium]